MGDISPEQRGCVNKREQAEEIAQPGNCLLQKQKDLKTTPGADWPGSRMDEFRVKALYPRLNRM